MYDVGRPHKVLYEVSCMLCERLHRPKRPLEFDPICSICVGRYPTGSLEMTGPHPLSHKTIDETVIRTSPGNYALGYMDATALVVFYVGRSDSDVKQCLHEWVGMPSRYKRYAPSFKAACASRHRGFLPLGAPALDLVGAAVDSSYTRFAFSYATSAQAAFEKECRNYHELGGNEGLDNECHPVPTLGRSWPCLVHDQ